MLFRFETLGVKVGMVVSTEERGERSVPRSQRMVRGPPDFDRMRRSGA